MRGSRLLWLVMGIWLLAYVWSFWAFATTPPSGDSFTRGLNRLIAFMQWQLLAGGIAIAIWIIGRKFSIGWQARWLSRAPGLLALLPVLAIVGLIVYSWVANPATPKASTSVPGSVTAPVD